MTIRIGCASAFWGDTGEAAGQLVNSGKIDYLVFDYLAEVTMSIMAGQQMKKPEMGYAHDFIAVLAPLLASIKQQGIKVVSNAGGVNVLACRDALQAAAEAAGIELKIAVVEGDNLSARQQEFRDANVTEMETGEAFPDFALSFNAYLGAFLVAEALAKDADVVITGRCVDSAVTIAPMIHEFGWQADDYDLLAAGALAGHIIECGAQCCGGNFTDWEDVASFNNIGFPIAECEADGSMVIAKPDGTDGLISPLTVAEQLVYEIGDASNYLLPDVTANFSAVQMQQVGENRVRVTGATGSAPTDTYKASVTTPDGYRIQAILLFAGFDARRKAHTVADALLFKARKMFAEQGWDDFTDVQVDALGSEALFGANSRALDSREVVLKIFVRHHNRDALKLFGKEVAQAATGMTPGITGFFGRPTISPVIRLFSCLVPKAEVPVVVDVAGQRSDFSAHIPGTAARNSQPSVNTELSPAEDMIDVPLIKLAVCRSGDKGNYANIGVIARQPEYLPWIRESLAEARVQQWFEHLLEEGSVVQRFEMPGLSALNFLLSKALGGGGMASLRADPQGKCYGQILLDIPISVPADLLG